MKQKHYGPFSPDGHTFLANVNPGAHEFGEINHRIHGYNGWLSISILIVIVIVIEIMAEE